MKQLSTQLDGIKLIGISRRTNNANEMDPSNAIIGQTIARFFQDNLAERITARKQPGVAYAVYTEYESDHHGDYTYFFGEAVNDFETIPDGLTAMTIPAGNYIKFTSPNGPIPKVIIDTWQTIWQMTKEDLGGKRVYQADFEVYDQRAVDPENTIVDIYIGVE